MYVASAGSEDFPPAHIWLHSYSSTSVQVDLRGSHWLSPPISSQVGPYGPVAGVLLSVTFVHRIPPFVLGNSSVFHTGRTRPAEEVAILGNWSYVRKNVHVFVYLN